MARPLEFRAWDIKNKTWINPDWFSILGNGTLIDSNTIDLKNCIVQQFCGLYDKNKKKIFEGDIISKAGAYVLWSERLACWAFDFKGEEGKNREVPLFYEKTEEFEIIGDIYRNPDLLSDSI